MQDRPTVDELLAAVERFLEHEVMANSEGVRRFHARVAANTLRIIRRELVREEEQLAAEWTGLGDLLGGGEQPERRAPLREAIAAQNEQLCRRIREGEADSGEFREKLLAHVRRTVRDKLLVSNPGWVGK